MVRYRQSCAPAMLVLFRPKSYSRNLPASGEVLCASFLSRGTANKFSSHSLQSPVAISPSVSIFSYSHNIAPNMRPSFPQVTALVLSSISLTLDFESLSFPSIVTANKDTDLQIANELSSDFSSFDVPFDSFRVYLATTPPGSSTAPQSQPPT